MQLIQPIQTYLLKIVADMVKKEKKTGKKKKK